MSSSTTSDTTSDPRQQLAQLQSELSERQSTTCFAQAGLSLIASTIFAGAAGKLFWDALPGKTPYLAFVATTVALGLAVFAVVRYLKGRSVLRVELLRYEQLLGLRRTLGLDDPSTLLPNR